MDVGAADAPGGHAAPYNHWPLFERARNLADDAARRRHIVLAGRERPDLEADGEAAIHPVWVT